MKTCPVCKRLNPESSDKCLSCGYELNSPVQQVPTTKKCPYCAEEIKAEAIFCRFCNHEIRSTPIITNYQPSQQKKSEQKNQNIRNVVMTLITIILLFYILQTCFRKDEIEEKEPVQSTEYVKRYKTKTSNPYVKKVSLEITGSADSVSITMTDEYANIVQGDYQVPFSKTLILSSGSTFSISAQNNGEYGSITCNIYADDNLIETSTSEGAYKIVSCDGFVP